MHNSKNEIEQFLNRYLLKKIEDYDEFTFVPCPSTLDENEILSFIQNRQPFEEPDGLSLIGNTVMLFEHFEFDASKNTKKGSDLQKIKSNDRNRSMEALNEMDNKEIIFQDKTICQVKEFNSYIETKVSKEDYINNLIKQFTSHCNKRKNYESRIRNELQNNTLIFKECFLIEEKNLLGCLDINKNIFNICLTNEFISVWKQHPEVNYIILGINNTCFLLSNCLLEMGPFESIYNIDIIIPNHARAKRTIISTTN